MKTVKRTRVLRVSSETSFVLSGLMVGIVVMAHQAKDGVSLGIGLGLLGVAAVALTVALRWSR
ncbi:MAG: hypothetical protein FJ027_09945 [Candidatus Rokubacteria bacterium]|nr:hypothetical protein [Candidatus Rokubacteria bacterium]